MFKRKERLDESLNFSLLLCKGESSSKDNVLLIHGQFSYLTLIERYAVKNERFTESVD